MVMKIPLRNAGLKSSALLCAGPYDLSISPIKIKNKNNPQGMSCDGLNRLLGVKCLVIN